MVTKTKCYGICAIISIIMALLLVGVAIFTKTSLDGVLKSEAASNVWLTPKSYHQWGQIPGDLDIKITRNYVFYNFTNPFEVFYFNETPKFVETKGYVYREYQNLTDVNYSAPNSKGANTVVDYHFQLYMLPEGATDKDLITTPNLGAMGFWHSAHVLPDYQYATYALSQLAMSFEQGIPTTLGSTGIKISCIQDETVANGILTSANITDPDIQKMMWNDPIHGFNSTSSLPLWVEAIAGQKDSGAAKILQDYFYLTDKQIMGLVGSETGLSKCLNTVNDTIANGYKCSTTPCDPHYLAELQWAQQGVTLHPAGGEKHVNASDSVTTFNKTASGFPEIAYFQNKYFIPKNPQLDPVEYNLTWSLELTHALLNYTPNAGEKYRSNQDTLLHVGNQKFLHEVGAVFDKSNKTEDLQPIVDRFHLPNVTYAHVLYAYVRYFVVEFASKQEELKGGKGELVLGQFVSQALYKNITYLTDNLLADLTARLILKELKAQELDCYYLLVDSLNGMTEEKAEKICASPLMTPFDTKPIRLLAAACNKVGGALFKEIADKTGFGEADLGAFCATECDNCFFTMMLEAQSTLKDHYKCGQDKVPSASRCSSREVAVLQWGSSAITQRVPPGLEDELKPSNTVKDWYPNDVKKPFEYVAVINLLKKNLNETTDLNPIDYDMANGLLTFDILYNQVTVQNAFLFFKNQKWEDFARIFLKAESYPLITYLKYVMMDIALGGFSQTRTVNELLWGYVDPVVNSVKTSNPITAGDPSLLDVINIAGENVTYEGGQAFPVSMYTGVDDTRKTRTFKKFFGSENIVFPTAYFNGNETVPYNFNPWAEDIPLSGGDGTVNIPGLSTSDNVEMYIPDINFKLDLAYSGSNVDHFGVDSFRYQPTKESLMNKANNPKNAKWFADRWDGVVNISASRKCPLFVCKAHYLDTDKELGDAVEIYSDAELKNRVYSSSADAFWLDIEPYSGVALGANAALQVNVEFKQDELFNNPRYALLPVATTIKGFNMTEKQISTVYGPLKAGLGVKNKGALIASILALVFLALGVFCFFRRRAIFKKTLEILPRDNDGASYYKFDYNPAPINAPNIDYHPTMSKLSNDEA